LISFKDFLFFLGLLVKRAQGLTDGRPPEVLPSPPPCG